MAQRSRVIVWADLDQRELVSDAFDDDGIELQGVGSPDPDDAHELADAFKTARMTDLRDAVLHCGADVLWLASRVALDRDERKTIRESELPCVSNQPRPLSASELQTDPDEANTAVFVPLFRASPGFHAAIDAMGEFGTPRSVLAMMACRSEEGSLAARIFDAVDLITHCAGRTLGVHGARSGPRSAVPESLEELRGDVTANLTTAENVCAAFAASDDAPTWSRSVTLLGQRGRMLIDDRGFEWTGQDGSIVDAGGETESISAGRLIGDHIRRMIEGRMTATQPTSTAALISLCESVRLSCRTGQVETPHRMAELMRNP